MSLSRFVPRLALFCFAAVAALACNASPPTPTQEVPTECAPGDACTCTDTCQRLCNGAGCYFQCNSGDCTFNCPNGECHAYAEGASSAALACADGGCTLESNGAGAYTVNCPRGGCGMYCTGATTCAIVNCPQDCTIRCNGVPDGGCQNSCGDAGNCLTYAE